MPLFRVTAELTISMQTMVEAKNPAEAKRLANDRAVISLCHQCAGGDSSEEWVTSGELDGMPTHLHATKEK